MPTALLKARGSWRAKQRKGEPEPELARPRCPKWLSAGAKSAWKRIAPQLQAMGVLARVDRNALARYCTIWAKWVDLERAPRGVQLRTAEDLDSLARCAEASIKLSQELHKLEQQFGLTPSARTRIRVDKDANKKPATGGVAALIRLARPA